MSSRSVCIFALVFAIACFFYAVNCGTACCCPNYRFNTPLDVVEECLYQHDYFTDQWSHNYNGYASANDACYNVASCGCLICDDDWDDIYQISSSSTSVTPIRGATCNFGNSVSIDRTWNFCGVLSLTQNIDIVDTIAPELFIPPDRVQECMSLGGGPGPNFSFAELDNWFGSARATDLCTNPILTESVAVDGSATNCNYLIHRTFTADDGCNLSIQTQDVRFMDTTAPVMYDSSGSVFTFTCDQTASYTPANALQPLFKDACDNVGPSPVRVSDVVYPGRCSGEFSIERTWSVADTCGNTGFYLQTIIVEDPDPPIVSLGGVPNSGVNHYSESTCVIPAPNNYVLQDNCDAGVRGATYLTYEETITGVNEFESHFDVIRTYRATDDCGNYVEWQDVVNVNRGGGSYSFVAPEILNAQKGTNINIGYSVFEFSCIDTYIAFDIGAAEFVSIVGLTGCTNSNGGLLFCQVPAGTGAGFTLTIFVPTSYAPNNLEIRQSTVFSNPIDHYGFNSASRTIIQFA